MVIKSKFETDEISTRIGLIFSEFGLSPDAWTLLSLVPAVLGFFALVNKDLPLALVLFLLSGFLDAVDGAVAKFTGTATAFGAFLDGVVDRYVEILLYLGLLSYGIGSVWIAGSIWIDGSALIAVLIFGAMMTSYMRAYADHRGVVTEPHRHKEMGGLLERPERLSLIYLGMFLANYYQPDFLQFSVIMAGILANLTAIQRFYYVVENAR